MAGVQRKPAEPSSKFGDGGCDPRAAGVSPRIARTKRRTPGPSQASSVRSVQDLSTRAPPPFRRRLANLKETGAADGFEPATGQERSGITPNPRSDFHKIAQSRLPRAIARRGRQPANSAHQETNAGPQPGFVRQVRSGPVHLSAAAVQAAAGESERNGRGGRL